jgi:hypothetical protein
MLLVYFSIVLWGALLACASPNESNRSAGNIILKAARKHADLAKKSGDIFLTNDITLSYVEGIMSTSLVEIKLRLTLR